MRYASWTEDGRDYAGIVAGDGRSLHPFAAAGLRYATLLEFIEHHTADDVAALKAVEGAAGRPFEAVCLQAPIPRPANDVICVGLNYRDHVSESARLHLKKEDEAPKAANYFSKRAYRPAGHGQAIAAPFALDSRVDYEAEVGVVIGKAARNVPPQKAWEHVFGLCCFNDLTARDLQQKHGQWFFGKSLDGLTAFGPCIVSRDEFCWPLALEVVSRVNGEERQRSNTGLMITPIDSIISELSAGLTLVPGSLIATGTPSGVGAGFTPPRCLHPGDVCEIEVEGVGVLRNSFV